jgi:hypothetical protein
MASIGIGDLSPTAAMSVITMEGLTKRFGDIDQASLVDLLAFHPLRELERPCTEEHDAPLGAEDAS